MKRIVILAAVLTIVSVGCTTDDAVPTPPTGPAADGSSDAIAPGGAGHEGGPVRVSGEFDWTSGYIARHYEEPVALLMDVSNNVLGDYTEFVELDGQIMGVLTRPLDPAPTAYEVDLPIRPDARLVDVDNDGEDDLGVQIYAAVIGTNLVGDSYLEQVEQEGFKSVLTDPLTGNIREGTLLVYAPDDQQGFPSGAGPDGEYFTSDDPSDTLPAGYTLATLSPEGQVSFDRAEDAIMDILEPASQASPDFSDQGVVEAFNSLIDLLKVRYSYTELRGLDWEAIRAEHLPRMQEAERAGDSQTYLNALTDLALSIRDAHVRVITRDQIAVSNYLVQAMEPNKGGFGVQIAEMSDGRFVVTYVVPDGPAADAGWQAGTEILSVDGVSLDDRIGTVPLLESSGNPEAIRVQQLERVLGFPVGTEVVVEYVQPDESQVRSATLEASYTEEIIPPGPSIPRDEISFRALENGYHYIQWRQFQDDAYKIAAWAKFLNTAREAPGIVIDLRENQGGGLMLMYTMMSYLFAPDDPARMHWIDSYVYDDQANDLVMEFTTDYTLSSPDPDVTYSGLVAVLVDEKSASAAEYFAQFLQGEERAIVVGEHSSEGAGGYLESVAMPDDLTFFFTKGRTYFAGTEELNLEAKGVIPDVRVPITLENELAKQEGTDVVLEAAVAALEEEAGRQAAETLPGTAWELAVRFSSEELSAIEIEDPTAYTLTFGDDGTIAVQADCNRVTAEYAVEGASGITIAPGIGTLAACPEGSYGEDFLAVLAEVERFETDEEQFVLYRGVVGVGVYDTLIFRPQGAEEE